MSESEKGVSLADKQIFRKSQPDFKINRKMTHLTW